MSDRDNITLPREVVEEVLEALEHAGRNRGGIYTLQRTMLRTALAAEQPKPSEDIEALRRDAYQGGWLRDWLDSNGLLARAIRGESLAGYEHPDIKALRRDAERYRWLRDNAAGFSGKTLDAVTDAAIDAAMKEGT